MIRIAHFDPSSFFSRGVARKTPLPPPHKLYLHTKNWPLFRGQFSVFPNGVVFVVTTPIKGNFFRNIPLVDNYTKYRKKIKLITTFYLILGKF